ncbi:Uncharacterized protein BP5553_05277 [Venustampulla echinocandica]|uniref:Fringe-like glycosyltransferase domain-containing protein n=1 Tax=Venustampulla echinocandica TaxID=2656787 RepID=A0A370TQQ0_9HELO|nr:Uncharacterized protein BP5553_05277 [Venustampulla echinocandica]RDL37844.1 Uncharacterized protein BP5553_05277 [Venustampulla echinocandica]
MVFLVAKSSRNRFSPRNPFTGAVYLTIFCIMFVLYMIYPSNLITQRVESLHLHVNHAGNISQRPSLDCFLDQNRLQSLQQLYKLGDNIEYARRYVRFHRQNIPRTVVTIINNELFPKGFDEVDIRNPPPATICLQPLDVLVPQSRGPHSVDASDLLFGISTTYKRLMDPKASPVKQWAHWLTDGQEKSNGAGLILRLVDASTEEIEEVKDNMKSIGIDIKVSAADSSVEMAKRYLALLPALYNETSRRHRRYLAMCDDDTFFPSMGSLLERLSEFDHTSDLYLGTLSEDVNNIQRHGSQAFGGAGVFFSVPLAAKVADAYENCSTAEKIKQANTGWGPQGDILLRQCIYEHTEATLTLIRDLHQLDIMGDPAGFYEAGLAPLSLHHFKGGMWHEAHPLEGAQIIHTCGEACFLQRFQTSDNFIVSNGFSVAYYPKGIDFNLHQVERTFTAAPQDYGWNLDFMMGPQRMSLVRTGRKVAWELKESEILDDRAVRQTYIRMADDQRWTYGAEGNKMFEKDGVLELIWISS